MNSASTPNNFFELLIEFINEKNDGERIVHTKNRRVMKNNLSTSELEKILFAPRQPHEFEELLSFIIDKLADFENLNHKSTSNNSQVKARKIDRVRLKDKLILEYVSKLISPEKEAITNFCHAPKIIDEDNTTHIKFQEKIKCYQTIINTLSNSIALTKDTDSDCLADDRSFEYFYETDDLNFFDGELETFLSHDDRQVINKNLPLANKNLVVDIDDTDDIARQSNEIKIISPYDNQRADILDTKSKISKYLELEDKLKKIEERFSLAMRGSNDGLWDWNLETNEVYYSPRWKNILGYQDDELENSFETWENLVHPDDKEIALTQVKDYLANKTDSFETEMRMRHKNGRYLVVLSRAFLINRRSDGKAVRLVGTHVDMTKRKKVEAFHQKNTEILEMIATGIPAPEIYDQIALMYEARNPGMRCSMLELENGTLLHGGAPSLPKAYCDAVNGLKNGPNVGSCGTSTYTGKRVLVEDIDTDPKWAKIKHVALPHGMRCCWSEPIKDSSGKVLGAFGMYYNHPALPNEEELEDLKSAARLAGIVMERDRAQKRIRELAYTDTLTGLASRANFYQNLEQSVQKYHQDRNNFAILYIDLDDFKSVNDTLGHDAGDLLLKEIARRLQSICRPIDFVARLGGDEFCLILQNIGDDCVPEHVARRCLETILKPIELLGRKVIPACSIGIAYYPNDGKDLSTLIKAADISLYVAKEQGKNRYVLYHPELSNKAEYHFRLEQNLKEAVEAESLSLVYQPQVKIETGEIIGVEALSRWYHPQLGEISPAEFIATAQKTGTIEQLTKWVLKTACNQAVEWKNKGFPPIRIAVNISANHFLDSDFVSTIKNTIEETGINPAQLELEVTETVIQTHEKNLTVFHELKDIGVLIAIDDFGTGYSSFASLKHLTVDCLKIDKYFIDDMMVDRKSQLLIRSMIEMAHNLEQTIVAEGVETIEQFNLLQNFGCDTIQGYLFSKPVTAKEISNFFEQSTEDGKCMWPYAVIC